jgi:DNA polymerase (family 10)
MSERRMDSRSVGEVLREIALLLELKGDNPFKVKAYSNAARSIEILEEDLGRVIREGRLKEIKGIGDALAHQITELVNTGKLQVYDDLKSSVPPGHLEMLKIPGLGPKKIKALYDALDIRTAGELEYACLENRLVELQGFGQKTQEKVLQGIQQIKKYQGRYLFGQVIEGAGGILKKVLSHPKVLRANLAGSLRRRMEVVRNINLVVSTSQPREVLTAFSKLPEVEVVQFKDKVSGRYALLTGVEVDLRTTSDQAFPNQLLQRTGNTSHWNAMMERAKTMGFTWGEEGLRRNGRGISCKEEEGIFEALGLHFIPPELRENQGEIEAAELHQLPLPVEDQDIKGVFHVHSSYSDGTTSIKSMALAARTIGFSYIGLSDHSQTARYAGGLNFEKLKKQWEEIDQVNKEMDGFHIFKGTESDILPDGSLDYDEAVLKRFDFVIASVHSHFTMSLEEMTQRMVKAIRNPFTTILGHPTGRLLLAREAYPVDMTRLIDEASKAGVAIELNAHPYRLDIDWRLCKYAKEKGAKIIINPDAHEEAGLKDTYFGVGIARKGWLEPGDILNTMDLEEMKEFLKKRKRS